MSEEMSRAELAEDAAAQRTCIGCAMGVAHDCTFGRPETADLDEEHVGIVVAVSSGGWNRNFSFDAGYTRARLVLAAEEIDIHTEGPTVELTVDAFTHRVEVSGLFDSVGVILVALAGLLARVNIHPEDLAESAADRIENACEVMHDAYEKAAIGAGWETREASRKPWSDVPEPNIESEAERDALRAKVARIEALRSKWETTPHDHETSYREGKSDQLDRCERELASALQPPPSDDAEPNGPTGTTTPPVRKKKPPL